MMKTLEAIFRGYFLFRVNDRYFFTYTKAINAKNNVPKSESVQFEGRHILKGWSRFYTRIAITRYLEPEISTTTMVATFR